MSTKRLGFRTLQLLGLSVLGSGCASLLGLDEFSETSASGASTSSSGGAGGKMGTGGAGGASACEPGTQMACESGLLGACAAGMQTCKPDGMGYASCVPGVMPSSAPEDCKKLGDEDCDGVACSDAVWSFLAGDASSEEPKAIAVDAMGNIFVTGKFTGTLKLLDKVNKTSIALNASGNVDIFLAKLTPLGDVIWAKSFGNATLDGDARAIAVDAAGSVVIAGGFGGTINFGSGVLTASGFADAFVAKFDASGTPQWSKRFGASTNVSNVASAVAIDSNGDVVLGGILHGPVAFDGTTLPLTQGADVFVTKLASTTGLVSWAKQFKEQSGTTNVNQFLARLTTDSSGNIFLTGIFQGSIVFTATAATVGGGQDFDAFVAKLDTNGKASWGKTFGSAAGDEANAIAVDGSGNVLVTGQVRGDTDWGPGPVVAPGGAGSQSAFIVKYTNFGVYVNARILSASAGLSLDADPADNVYLTGSLGAVSDLGGGDLPFGGGSDIFLAKFDASFGHVWSKSFGDAANQSSEAVRYDKATKSVILAGAVKGNIDFGPGVLTGLSTVTPDLALAKFQP